MEELPFFVYGTLRRGQGNYRLLRGRTVREVRARLTTARLYDIGGLPMAIEGKGQVTGEIMTISPNFYEDMLARLDRLEGVDHEHPDRGFYRRVICTPFTEDGKSTRAWVYLGTPEYMDNAQYISHGDWARHRRTREGR